MQFSKQFSFWIIRKQPLCVNTGAPGESLKLKQLKLLINEHSPSSFSNISSEEALNFLKNKLGNSDRFSIKGKKVLLVKRS
ncbi:hypothetical protein OROGR_005697 [Orobanche gracilis]